MRLLKAHGNWAYAKNWAYLENNLDRGTLRAEVSPSSHLLLEDQSGISARSVRSPISCEFSPWFQTLPIVEFGPCEFGHIPCWYLVILHKKKRLKLAKHHTWLKQNIRARYQHLLVTQSTSFEINGYLRGWAQSRSTCFPILEAHFETCKLPKVILVVSVLFSSVGLSWLFCFYELSY